MEAGDKQCPLDWLDTVGYTAMANWSEKSVSALALRMLRLLSSSAMHTSLFVVFVRRYSLACIMLLVCSCNKFNGFFCLFLPLDERKS